MKVLYAVDGSAPAQAAGRVLMKVADPGRTELTVLSVPPTLGDGGYDQVVTEAARRLVEESARQFSDAGFAVETMVPRGDPPETILDLVQVERYGLTVVGGGRQTWEGRRMLGSTGAHVLHSSPTSVLLAHRAPSEDHPAPVLLGADGSSGSLLAADTLAALSDPSRVTVTAFSVALDPGPAIDLWPLPTGTMPPEDIEGRRTASLAEAETHARAAADRLAAGGFTVSARAEIGSPAIALLAEAEARYGLVVVGSRGLGPVRRALLGSVSDQVAHAAPATLVARRAD